MPKQENKSIIKLQEFQKLVDETADETIKEFPNLYLYYAGINPTEGESFRYDSSPTNTKIFANTGGDGVHFSILELSDHIQPIVMTVPMNFGDSMQEYNKIIAENLNEFLSLGYYNGWFWIEQFCYDKEKAINFYAKEDMEEEYQNGGDIQFVKKLRRKLKYYHIPLDALRLKDLEDKYFGELQFNQEFIDTYIKK